MTAKTIDEMIAELPGQPTNYPGSRLRRALAEVALLRSALVQRDGGEHDEYCRVNLRQALRNRSCNCGHDDANKVLEVTK
jgi:hypothetical protein